MPKSAIKVPKSAIILSKSTKSALNIHKMPIKRDNKCNIPHFCNKTLLNFAQILPELEQNLHKHCLHARMFFPHLWVSLEVAIFVTIDGLYPLPM